MWSLAGGNWAPVAAIQHFGDTAYIGHYTAIIRDGDGWVYCNDLSENRITPCPQGLPQDLADVAILVLERIDNVTTEQAVLQVDDISDRQDADINKNTEDAPPPPAEAAPQARSKPKTRASVKRDKPTGRAGVQEEAHLPPVQAAPQPSAPILPPANRTRFTVDDDQVLSIVNGDMLKERAGAIVNAANAGLQSGGGVCGLIFQNAGHAQMEKACKELRKKLPRGQLKGGMAVTTPTFGLGKQFDFVIHTAAPNVSGTGNNYNGSLGRAQAEEHLRDCYINALKEADANNVDSIVFPILGVGIYGYDLRQGIAVAMQSILCYFPAFPKSSVRVATLCLLSASHYNLCTMLAGDMTALRAFDEEGKVAFRKMIEHNALAGQPPTGFINFMDQRMPSFVGLTLPSIPPPPDQEETSRPKRRASVKRTESTGRSEALPSPPAKKMSSSGYSSFKGMVSRILRSNGKKPTKK